jgi:hypothetical protein
MSRLSLLACLTCLVASAGFAPAQTLAYAVTGAGQFGTLDLDTGDFTVVDDMTGIDFKGIGNLDDGTLTSVGGDYNFIQIDPVSGAITAVGPTGITVSVSGSLLTGEQYAMDPQNDLYAIDPSSGAATLVGPTGLPHINTITYANAFAGDDAYNLYYIFEQGGHNPVPSTLFQIDPTTGAATAIGLTGVTGIVGAGFVSGTLYAYGYNSQAIYTIDVGSGMATDTGVRCSPPVEIFGLNPGGAP